MAGRGFGYGYGAVGHARRNPMLSGSGATPTPVSAPSLPALAQIVGHFDSAQITPQGDNTNLTQWSDISGSNAHAAQATSGFQPKYRTAGGAGLNGLAYVQFDGVDDFLSIATPGALKTALDGLDYTILVVVDNVSAGSGDYGTVFGTGVGGDNLHLWATGTQNGYGSSATYSMIEHGVGAGYQSFGFASAKTNGFGGSGGPNLRRNLYRGTIYSSSVTAGLGTGGKTLAIGSGNIDSAPTFRFKGRMYRIIVWAKTLTAAEIMQAETYFNWFYNQVHPAVTLGRFLSIDGDSRYAGVGVASTAQTDSIGYKIANGLGFSPGTYANYAIGGLTIQKLIDKGGEVDAVAQALTARAPSMQHRLLYEEFFNSRALPVSPVGTAGTMAYQTRQYVDARRAGMPASLRIVGASPFDHADINNTAGTASGAGAASPWAAYIEANWAALGFDALADVWANATLGGDTANPAGDGVHLNAAGQTIQAGIVIAAATALAGW